MALTTTGDLSQHFLSARRTVQVKDRLHRLSDELSTGKVADVALALHGETTRVSHLEHRIALADSHVSANRETGGLFAQAQLVLGKIEDRRAALTEQVLSLPANSTRDQRESVAAAARETFESIVGDLNHRVGGKSLFAGEATDRAALAAPDVLLNDLLAAVAGASGADQLLDAVDAWFDDPAGFESRGYLGDPAAYLNRPLGDGTSATLSARADMPALRGLLKAAALGALAAASPGLGARAADAVLRHSGVLLASAAQPLALAQGSLGLQEDRIEQASAQQAAERSSLAILQNELTSADPYATATALQSVEIQLEMSFMLTARLSRLSLSEHI
ncbi:flagellar hook-associated protein FlgL family protein [Oceanicola granulosus HTCC2516]|uniref:Flagellar hook-associated protein FlgL family protein n=1 Tax=Oceanicola granulosus (strain ATCC BAA-861 / DSM 15982 / KCTC 12143 / HTCC2516) TaxID=314256 RepID=Q2CJJ7_OCEGH|nr:flagellin [Oceanicola granulosus]EAR53142.1 flagellar hook-associated protein FlgL family protein [Oceanicola granulosus HTCC2516]